MNAQVFQIRDYLPAFEVVHLREDPCEIIILPMITAGWCRADRRARRQPPDSDLLPSDCEPA